MNEKIDSLVTYLYSDDQDDRLDCDAASMLQELQSRLEELNRKVAELENDAEMLDWLEQSGEGHAFCHTGYGEYRYYAHQQEGFNTVRETIGAAMQASNQ